MPLEMLLLAVLLGWPGLAPAQSLRDEELDGLLRTFASFTRWPVSALRADQEPLLICLQGGATLRSQQPVAPQGAGMTVRRVVASDDLRRCHLLFVPASEQQRLRDSVSSVSGAPVLIVSDAAGALKEGVTIEVAAGMDRVQFEVNLGAAQRNHLVISSKLLRVARRVVHTASNP
ncbi:MAG: YfiR family protein [Burkholderiales bacterium]|nr:YfiR family protein [Burkholderiales bacterium]